MKIKNVGVLGAGTMGHGIAELAALASWNVMLCDISEELLTKALNAIKENLNAMERSRDNCSAVMERIRCVTSIHEAVKSVDLVIECLPENLEFKQKVFKELDEVCAPDVILATNTSGLSPTAIAKDIKHPERVVVAHFWNPPQLIPLVEVVPGEKTSKEVVDKTMEWVKALGKQPVRMNKECLGFIGNRLQLALLREALYIVEQGYADVEEVDKSMIYGHGRRLPVTGPFCSADMGGLDIFHTISTYLFPDLSSASEPSKLMQKIVEEGNLGLKSGKGFYEWTPEMKEKMVKRRTETLIDLLEKDKKTDQS
ncbi:MAG: 3-hydroxybutyryl-CoA dehydrogenase [Syntrophus sp. (in: bacteria)]|nr:3-hydroxybutyryl-CoA dehydrogenase [Syntrophus sp. (in: bacteria)]MBA4419068.1 3-hydroxybutyryl-CoA dehydrogenase [Syntrophus sp. (in: bacteria)]